MPSKMPVWLRLILALAVVRILTGIAGYWLGGPVAPAESADTAAPSLPLLLDILAFSAGAVLLLVGGREDPRARYLGAFFLVLATSLTNWSTGALAAALDGTARALVTAVKGLQADAFLPLLLWLFVREFPHAPGAREDRRLELGVGLSAAYGLILFTANLVKVGWTEGSPFPAALASLVRDEIGYYPPIMSLMLAALVVLVLRTRKAPLRARRRARVFVFGLLIGAVPIFATSLLVTTLPPFQRSLENHPGAFLALFLALHGCLMVVPFATAYAVLVQRILDVKLIARQAVKYLLARGSVVALTLVPLVALGAFLYQNRSESLASLFAGGRLLLLAGAAGLGIATLRYRRPLLEGVDRRFFRERYDARRLLTELSDRLRDSRDPLDLARLLLGGIDRALHLTRAALLVDDPHRGHLSDPQGRTRPLDSSSALAQLTASAREPLDVDLEARRSPARRLPRDDRYWLVDEGFKLVMPLMGSDGSLLGLLALGEKLSGLPFLKEDRELLQAVANAAALGLELFRLRAEPSHRTAADAAARPAAVENARECLSCGNVQAPSAERCNRCGATLGRAGVPFVLPGRFRFEERIGVGGMGVVYRARDLALGRPVAIKTLRSVSPEHALRLRREARTAAAVTHPNLAFVYGLETWSGTPMLIMEFLGGGTLAERIRQAPLPPREVGELGVAMAEALARLHEEDLLHRDVKPSNIGFTPDGTPKLMDFGIARLRTDLRREGPGTATGSGSHLPATSIWNTAGTVTTEHHVVGTLAYIAPELLDGEEAGPSCDLWGLALVLHESLTGERVFRQQEDDEALIRRIRNGRVPDVRQVRSDCPEPLAACLSQALARDPEGRPRTARDFARALRESLSRMAA